MKSMQFKESNITFAKNQTEYQPLPAYNSKAIIHRFLKVQ